MPTLDIPTLQALQQALSFLEQMTTATGLHISGSFSLVQADGTNLAMSLSWDGSNYTITV